MTTRSLFVPNRDVPRLRQAEASAKQQYRGLLMRKDELVTLDESYSDLSELLGTLPLKTSERVMVPFGSAGFMPGRLVHTNEMLVHLGENTMALRSASQAQDIISRRREALQASLGRIELQVEDAREELHRASVVLSKAEGMEDEIVEIREEYHSEEDDDEDDGATLDNQQRSAKSPSSFISLENGDATPTHTLIDHPLDGKLSIVEHHAEDALSAPPSLAPGGDPPSSAEAKVARKSRRRKGKERKEIDHRAVESLLSSMTVQRGSPATTNESMRASTKRVRDGPIIAGDSANNTQHRIVGGDAPVNVVSSSSFAGGAIGRVMERQAPSKRRDANRGMSPFTGVVKERAFKGVIKERHPPGRLK